MAGQPSERSEGGRAPPRPPGPAWHRSASVCPQPPLRPECAAARGGQSSVPESLMRERELPGPPNYFRHNSAASCSCLPRWAFPLPHPRVHHLVWSWRPQEMETPRTVHRGWKQQPWPAPPSLALPPDPVPPGFCPVVFCRHFEFTSGDASRSQRDSHWCFELGGNDPVSHRDMFAPLPSQGLGCRPLPGLGQALEQRYRGLVRWTGRARVPPHGAVPPPRRRSLSLPVTHPEV